MAKDGLINCKKCGTLFFKNSEREICETCFKKELDTIDNIKNFIKQSEKTSVTMDEIVRGTKISQEELEDLITRGRLFAVLPKIQITCRFCGAELANDEKTNFTCKKCLMKFSPKANELEKQGIDLNSKEREARTLNRRLRGGMNTSDSKERYGFIQNFDL